LISSFLLLLPGNPEVRHDFHVSRIKITYAEAQGELQMTLHLFIDDLEEALRQQGIDGLRLGTAREAEEADRHLFAYLQRRLQLRLEDEPLGYQLLGKEVSEDLGAFYLYLLVEEVPRPHRLWVRNNLLFELFDDQQNIVQLIGPGYQRGNFIFHHGYQEDTAVFE
jgi:hypothetical protein